MLKHTLKEIVQNGNMAKIMHVCAGIVYYRIDVGDSSYQLAIDSMEEEWETTYLVVQIRAITLMRWIRKAIKTETLIQLK